MVKFDALADQHADALSHLPSRLVGEGHRQNLVGRSPAGGEDMRDAGGEHPRLARAGAGQHQDRSIKRLDGRSLLGVETLQIGSGPCRGHRTGSNAAGGRLVGEGRGTLVGQDALSDDSRMANNGLDGGLRRDLEGRERG
jgi:hypothetical protein